MASRLHSANTLLEGMNMVTQNGDASSRKRELEALIAAPFLHKCTCVMLGLQVVHEEHVVFLLSYMQPPI